MENMILQHNEFALCVDVKYARGMFSKTWNAPPGTRVQIWRDGEFEEVPSGGIVLDTFAERVNRFFQDKPGNVYLYRTSPLEIQFWIEFVPNQEEINFNALLIVQIQMLDIDAFRVAFMDNNGPVSVDRVKEVLQQSVRQAIRDYIKTVSLENYAKMTEAERMVELKRVITPAVNGFAGRRGLILAEMVGFALDNPDYAAMQKQVGQARLAQYGRGHYLALEKEEEKIRIEQALLDDAQRDREFTITVREWVERQMLADLEQAKIFEQQQASQQQKIKLNEMASTARRAEVEADAEVSNNIDEGRTRLEQLLQDQNWANNVREQIASIEFAKRRAALAWDNLAHADAYGTDGKIQLAESDLKALMMLVHRFAEIVKADDMSPEKAESIGKMFNRMVDAFERQAKPQPPPSSSQTERQRSSQVPPRAAARTTLFADFAEAYGKKYGEQRTRLKATMINGYGSPIPRAKVDDDFLLKIESAQLGFCIVFATSENEGVQAPTQFVVLTPNVVSRLPCLAPGTYILPGKELLPLPNAVLGFESERLYFNDPGHEKLLIVWFALEKDDTRFAAGTCYDSLPDLGMPAECIAALRPAPFEQRWEATRMDDVLGWLLHCNNLMLANLDVAVTV